MYRADRFADRAQAGQALGTVVARYLGPSGSGTRPLVMALPRGGVPVGAEVARAIGADLDIVVARKIGLPWQPELGVGAVTADGPPVLDRQLLARVRLSEPELRAAVDRERAEVYRRLRRYRGDRPPPVVADRVVVVVDDGLATGVTARAAVASLRTAAPRQLIFAVPVCAPQSAQALRPEVDAVLWVLAPPGFHAVGEWYDDFRQLSDAQVVSQLAAAWGA